MGLLMGSLVIYRHIQKLKDEHDDMESMYKDIKQDYDNLKINYNTQKVVNDELVFNYTNTSREYDNLIVNYGRLKGKLEEERRNQFVNISKYENIQAKNISTQNFIQAV